MAPNIIVSADDMCYDPLFIGEINPFIHFFYKKFGSFYDPVTTVVVRDESQQEQGYYYYKGSGVYKLFKDLEYAFIMYGFSQLFALSKIFQCLIVAMENYVGEENTDEYLELDVSFQMMERRFCSLWSRGYIFTKKYEELHSFLNFSEDIVRTAFLSGNTGLLAEMLKFGGMMSKPQDTLMERDHAKHVISLLLIDHPELRLLSDFYFEDSLAENFDEASRRRLFVVMWGLELLVKIRIDPDNADHYKQCLQLAFDAIPEPNISVREIHKALKNIVRSSSSQHLKIQVINQIMNEFKSHFPESVSKVGPRSLKHLCRVQVRQNYRQTHKFIHNMYFYVDLPTSLWEYVSLGLFQKKFPVPAILKYLVKPFPPYEVVEFPRIREHVYELHAADLKIL